MYQRVDTLLDVGLPKVYQHLIRLRIHQQKQDLDQPYYFVVVLQSHHGLSLFDFNTGIALHKNNSVLLVYLRVAVRFNWSVDNTCVLIKLQTSGANRISKQ